MTKYAGAEWLQRQINGSSKPFELSNIAKDVADIMGQLEAGLYHWENVVSKKGWRDASHDYIELTYPNKLNSSSILFLSMLCFSKKIECRLSPSSPYAVKLSFIRVPDQKLFEEITESMLGLVAAISEKADTRTQEIKEEK